MMTAAAHTLLDTAPSFGEYAMTAIALMVAWRVLRFGRPHHWPIFVVAWLSVAACILKMAAPEYWTPGSYVLIEGSAAVVACCIAGPWQWSDGLTLAGALFLGFGLLEAPSCTAYVFLALCDLCCVAVLVRARPADPLSVTARWGIGFLLSFQALRGALFGVHQHLAEALNQVGWAVFCLAFFLIARQARRYASARGSWPGRT